MNTMTIDLPKDLESSIRAEVASGHFASIDEAMAEAARLLLRELRHSHATAQADESPDPLLGLWRDYADEMDEIVAEAYRKRREEPWREFAL